MTMGPDKEAADDLILCHSCGGPIQPGERVCGNLATSTYYHLACEPRWQRKSPGYWEVLASEYEKQLRALCESNDPIALLADWAAHAGLPEPKAASEIAALRSRAEKNTDALSDAAGMIIMLKAIANGLSVECDALRSRVAQLEGVAGEWLPIVERQLERLVCQAPDIVGTDAYACASERVERLRAVLHPTGSDNAAPLKTEGGT